MEIRVPELRISKCIVRGLNLSTAGKGRTMRPRHQPATASDLRRAVEYSGVRGEDWDICTAEKLSSQRS